MAAISIEPGTKGAGPKFVLPDSSDPAYTYGIDVSHHNIDSSGSIDWNEAISKNVRFVFLKATQGSKYIDPTFRSNWQGAESANTKDKVLRVGAYHFFSANVDAQEQANSFIKVMETYAKFSPGKHLPPCLDLEWDYEIKNGKLVTDAAGRPIDRWRNLQPVEIAAKVNTWIDAIKAKYGVEPIIYSNAQWWSSVGLNGNKFGPKIWVADYSAGANSKGKPGTPPNHRWLVWQFTENAYIGKRTFDGNKYLKDAVSFDKDMGILAVGGN